MRIFSCFKPLVLLALALAVPLAAAQITCKVTERIGCFSDFIQSKRCYPVGPIDVASQVECAAYCSIMSYKHQAVEFGGQCFCGSDFAADAQCTKLADEQCAAMKCSSGDDCGGANAMLVFDAACSGSTVPNYQECTSPESKLHKFCDATLSAEDRLADLLQGLSLSDKVSLVSPDPTYGDTCSDTTAPIPSKSVGPYGWLVETNTNVASGCPAPASCATSFPGPAGLGASFNRSSWRAKGTVIGNEMRALRNIGGSRFAPGNAFKIGLTGFGPNINIVRDPRFGRNSELPGEDPVLSGEYAGAFVSGMQETDARGHPKMLAFLKHFTAYSVETNRGHDSYVIDPYDFFDTYVAQYRRAFAISNATGVMCSYNAENGHPSCANDFLLNTVLRGEFKADAVVTSDCGAVENLKGAPVYAESDEKAAAYAMNNGTDLEMGSKIYTNHLTLAVHLGLTTEAAVDAAIKRLYLPLFRAGRFDDPSTVEWSKFGLADMSCPLHKQIQYEAALQSFVLLKNGPPPSSRTTAPLGPPPVLPLRTGTKIAVVGPQAIAREGLLEDYAADQQCFGGGYDCIVTIGEAITAANVNGQTTVVKGVDVNSSDSSGIAAALAAAAAADVIVLVLGNDRTQEHETLDRTDTALPGLQEPFAMQVFALGKPVVMVLTNGGALAIDNLMSQPNAIVEAFNPGVGGAVPLAHSLFGVQNRWGKMPVTMYPHDYIKQQDMTNFNMSRAPGRTYRYYTGQPLFAFGHGLSLTTFNMSCSFDSLSMKIACIVSNTGSIAGDEVVMVFHSAGDDIRKMITHPAPIQSLRNFERVSIAPGGTETLVFALETADLMMTDEKGNSVLIKGTHHIFVNRDGVGRSVTFDIVV